MFSLCITSSQPSAQLLENVVFPSPHGYIHVDVHKTFLFNVMSYISGGACSMSIDPRT
jgi:hypothetical protein